MHNAIADPAVLNKVGIHEVVVIVDDINYQGSKTYYVEVVGEDGYSSKLQRVTAELAELTGNLTAESITATEENFEIVKGIEQLLATLDEEELQAEALDKYKTIAAAWHSAAGIDENVIKTAKAIGDSPIKWLYVAVAMNALVAAMYVVSKGGLLK